MVEKYHKQLEWNGIKRHLVYADNNLSGQKISTIKHQKNVSDDSKIVGLVVNTDKANCVSTPGQNNAG
jgi:hypothetical protein